MATAAAAAGAAVIVIYALAFNCNSMWPAMPLGVGVTGAFLVDCAITQEFSTPNCGSAPMRGNACLCVSV